MRLKISTIVLLIIISILAAASCSSPMVLPEGDPKLRFAEEKHLTNIRRLASGGTNAEAYWSFDGEWLSFQHTGQGFAPKGQTPEPAKCDQIYRMKADGSFIERVSSGKGRTTCAFYVPDNSRILYASTISGGDECPPVPDHSRGYIWPIYDTYQIYSAKPDGSDLFPIEPGAPKAYNAEAVVCHDGSVVFTSDRDGDLDLYTAKLDPLGTIKDIKRVTNLLGYDGGAVFSPDCKQLAWRSSRPKAGAESEEYKALLKQHLVRPTKLEIWVANADGSRAHQVTQVKTASFAPAFTPDGKHIVFSSNPRDPKGWHFDLYKVHVNGTGFEQVTYSNTFDSFPMFSPNGKHLAFSSNRVSRARHDTNVLVADWVDTPDPVLSMDDPMAQNRFMAVVEKLSTDEMEGRGPGTEGLKKAETVVADQMKKIGLKPFYETFKIKGGEGFMQPVEIKKGEKLFTANNVLATWGQGCGKVKPVVIGAHLDHLGLGAENSLEPNKSGIHHGADDNASGVAGMLEAARILVEDASLSKSCFVFMAFTGEEVNVAGSSRAVEALKNANALPKAMLNLDMVGRLEHNKLTVFGTDSAKEWRKLVDDQCGALSLTCPGGGDGYGPSDHMSFYIAKVPVLHFFTGAHGDYHRVSDLPSKVNAMGGVQVAQAVAAIAKAAASPKQKFEYQKAKEGTGNIFGKPRASNGAYLGTIPDYSTLSSPKGPAGAGAEGGGVPLAGARTGSPAELAGVKEGDVLLAIDEQKLTNLEHFTTVLGTLKPDQKIVLTVRRGKEVLKLSATVGKK